MGGGCRAAAVQGRLRLPTPNPGNMSPIQRLTDGKCVIHLSGITSGAARSNFFRTDNSSWGLRRA